MASRRNGHYLKGLQLLLLTEFIPFDLNPEGSGEFFVTPASVATTRIAGYASQSKAAMAIASNSDSYEREGDATALREEVIASSSIHASL